MRRLTRWSVFFICCLFGTPQAQAEPQQSLLAGETAGLSGAEECRMASVHVVAASREERLLACSAAREAIHLLGRCQISPLRPLHIVIMSEVHHPFSGAIFGLFDIKREKVLVTREGNISNLVKDTPYEKLPQREFYKSLILHEVVHAVMHQNLRRAATTLSAYEYPAYALQVESFSSSVRDQFLRSFEQDAIRADSVFNDSVLLFDPFFFAARAYQHFTSSTNGCAHLHALLEGEVPFIASMPLR